MALVGLREAARHLGIASAPLQRAITEGRVIPDESGLIDVEKARQSLEATRRRVPSNAGTKARPATLDDSPDAPRTLTTERLRELMLKNAAREIELDKLRGDLLPAEEVRAGWEDAIGRARALLLRVPFAAAPEAIAASGRGPAAVAAIIRQHIEDALTELADAESHDDGDDADELESRPSASRLSRKSVASAAEAEPEPVGRAALSLGRGRKRNARQVSARSA